MGLDTSALVEGIVSSAKASIAVILVMVYGYVFRRRGFISRDGESNISKLGTSLFLPCLLFSEIGPLATVSNLKTFWPIIPFSLFFQIVSLLVGIGSQMIFRFPSYYVPMFVFNNVTSLPLLLLQSLSKTGAFDTLLSDGESVSSLVKRGTVYILINALVGNLTRFALGPYLMKDHEPWTWLHPFSEDPSYQPPSIFKHGPLHLPSSPTLQSDDTLPPPSTEDGDPTAHDHLYVDGSDPTSHPSPSTPHKLNNQLKSSAKRVGTVLKHIISNPPLIGGLMAILIGLIPFLHKWMFSGGWLSPLADSIDNLGGLYTALQMFVLGAHLHSKQGSKASVPTLSGLFVWRFFLASVMTIGSVWLVRRWWPDGMVQDPMLDFVLMISNVGPPALTLSAVADMAHLEAQADGAVSRTIIISYALTPLIALPITAALQFASRTVSGV